MISGGGKEIFFKEKEREKKKRNRREEEEKKKKREERAVWLVFFFFDYCIFFKWRRERDGHMLFECCLDPHIPKGGKKDGMFVVTKH